MTNPNRQPKGISTGGQFAFGKKSESNVSLASSADEADDLTYRINRRPTSQEKLQEALDNYSEMTDRQLLDQARSSAHHHVRVSGLLFTEAEEVASETVMAVLAARQKDPTKPILPSYVHNIAFNVTSRMRRGDVSAVDRKAMAMYLDAIEEKARTLQRSLTALERDNIAASIRSGWKDQRHRPSADFVARNSNLHANGSLSLDDEIMRNGNRESGAKLIDMVSFREEVESVAEDSVAMRALSQAGQRNKSAAKAIMWDALCEIHEGLPPVKPGTLTSRKSSSNINLMAQGGGVGAAIQDWNNGDEDSDMCQLMFAPFGSITHEEKEAVVEVLGAQRHYNDQMYAVASNRAADKE